MADKKTTPKTAATQGKPVQTREDRLKSALKANLARRKAQARARADMNADATDMIPDESGATGKPER